jgi:uncharacterized repeat protein (TIGR01451 family)
MNPKSLKPGDAVVTTLTVKNVGNEVAKSVRLVDHVPTSLIEVRWEGALTGTGNTVSGLLGDIPAGESRVVTVHAKAGAMEGSFTNVVIAEADNAPAVSDSDDFSVRTPPPHEAFLPLLSNEQHVPGPAPEQRLCVDAVVLVNTNASPNIKEVSFRGQTSYEVQWTLTGGAELPSSVTWTISVFNGDETVTERFDQYRTGTQAPWNGWNAVETPTKLQFSYQEKFGQIAAGSNVVVTAYPLYGPNPDHCPQGFTTHHVDPTPTEVAGLIRDGLMTIAQVEAWVEEGRVSPEFLTEVRRLLGM